MIAVELLEWAQYLVEYQRQKGSQATRTYASVI